MGSPVKRCETFLETIQSPPQLNEQCSLVAGHPGDHIFEDLSPLRPQGWHATDEIAHEAQEIYDFKTKVADPYAMHWVLDHIVKKCVAHSDIPTMFATMTQDLGQLMDRRLEVMRDEILAAIREKGDQHIGKD